MIHRHSQLLARTAVRQMATKKPEPLLDIAQFGRQIPDSTSPSSLDWSHLDNHEDSHEPGRSEQKEEMIFKEVLSQVLSNPSKPQPKAARHSQSTPLADSILALFDKPASPNNFKSHEQEPGVSSLMDVLLNPSKTGPVLSPEQVQKREVATAQLSEVFKYIDELNTNREVLQFYESLVVRFDAKQRLDCAAGGEQQQFTPENVPVCPDTASMLLEKCIVVLQEGFNDILGALHLFELSKHHSVEFFSESCSAEVYNQIVKIRWYTYRDLYAVVNLAAEIAINAIPPTLETTELLSNIYRDAFDSSKGMSTSAKGMPLWTSQDVRRLAELNRYRTRFQGSWAAKPVLRY